MVNIDIRVKNTSKVVFEMRSIGELVVNGARKLLHAAGDRIVKEAKLNAPVDEYRLEESIHKEVSYEGPRGRLKIQVVAGGEIDGVNVDEYAAIIEKNYESYNPGEGTLEKRARLPDRYVGGHYMERAGETEEKRLPAKMIEGVTRVIKTGSTAGLEEDDGIDEEFEE